MSDSEKIRILLDQGLSAYGLGNRAEALEAWRTVLALDPGNTKAKEYIRFVEESWGPKQERLDGPAKPYRPDEGSGEISAPDILPVEPEPPAPSPPADDGGFEKDAFTPPSKPILQGDQWGDLYDFDKREPTATQEQPALPPPAPAPQAVPKTEPEPDLTPDQAKIKPLAGDWSKVLTPEEQAQQQAQQQAQDSASTLPPHPGEVEEIEIIEELEPEAEFPEVEVPEEELQEVEPEPVVQPEPATDDSMQRDELAPTKKYESVPTIVRPPQEVPPEAIPPSPPPVKEELARDSLDRFPEDPEPLVAPEPLEPEPGIAFYQTPRPETTPPLGSPILEPDSSDLLDLVGGGGEPEGAAAVPGISAASEVDSLLKGARDLLELDDFSGAMELLDKVLELEAGHPQAKKMRDEAEGELLSMLSSKLGDLNRTPRIRMSQDEIIWLNLDNRAGFVLSLVDGSLSLDEIISICGLPQLEGMRILVQLFQEKVIEIN